MRNEVSVLAIPPDILDKLHWRAMLAAEVPTPEPEMRAFVVVIPKVTVPEPTTHNLSPVLGYEVRRIRHHNRFMFEHGYDDDKILEDRQTRAERLFVLRYQNEIALIETLLNWKVDCSTLQRPTMFHSTLV